MGLLTSVWSLLEAARTIAWDLIPRIVAGFRLQRTQTFRSCKQKWFKKMPNLIHALFFFFLRNPPILIYLKNTYITINRIWGQSRYYTIISSRGIYLTRPLTTVLGCPSPTSISSTYKESASGCFWTFVIRPTRISSLDIVISASGADFDDDPPFVDFCFFAPPSVTKKPLQSYT